MWRVSDIPILLIFSTRGPVCPPDCSRLAHWQKESPRKSQGALISENRSVMEPESGSASFEGCALPTPPVPQG